jgi:CarD family transcriptional regulator
MAGRKRYAHTKVYTTKIQPPRIARLGFTRCKVRPPGPYPGTSNPGEAKVTRRPAVTAAMANAAFRAAADSTEPAAAFAAGDLVVYPSHGVGRVESIGTEEIAGFSLPVIRIHFPDNAMTLRIPLSNTNAGGLRPIATRETCAEIMTILAAPPRPSRMLWAKRAQDCQTRINSGDIRALAAVVRDLQAGPGDTGRSYSQRNLFELAIDRLGAEVAIILGVDKETAITRLAASLHYPDEAPLPAAANVA